MPRSPRFRHWCFTLNNYSDSDVEFLSELPFGATYLVYGKEVGSNGTPHLQGFVSFPTVKTFNQIQRLFNSKFSNAGHYEMLRGTVFQASQYCKKDGDYFELGELAVRECNQGKRNDLRFFVDYVKDGNRDLKKLRDEFPDICGRYPNFVRSVVFDNLPDTEIPMHPLSDWQASLLGRLKLPPNDREIIFVVDKEGNKGKSWFASYYEVCFPGSSVLLLPKKTADMAYHFAMSLLPDTRVVFIDAPRSKQGEFIQYDFLEDLKNGRVFSTKYESRMITFLAVHVVVLMNTEPDMTKLSIDRYHIINI